MKSIINHETYGQIIYDESFWTGKKNVIVNGQYLTKTDKNTFLYSNGQQSQYFILSGNFIKGASLTFGQQTIQLTPPIKWYELLLPIIAFIALLFWGTIPTLVAIFPLVGGAIGGLIDGIGSVTSALVMKCIKSVPYKLLAWLGITVLTILVNFLVATLVISALA